MEEGISDIAEDDREENVRRDCDFGDIPDDNTEESCLHGEDSDITGVVKATRRKNSVMVIRLFLESLRKVRRK